MPTPKTKPEPKAPKVGDVGGHIRRLQAERGRYVSGTWSHADSEATKEAS